jgi:hypothetical protein
LRRIPLHDALAIPVAEFCPGPYNGFGIYGPPGVDSLEVPNAMNFIISVLRCVSEYRARDSADARETCIRMMANHAEQAAHNANGQTVLRTVEVKTKKLGMLSPELENYIGALLDQQNNKCALTGISLQFDGADKNLLPSLDRINSEGDYVKGNLQVVCRFTNFWKSDTPNQEFLSLIEFVRAQTNQSN